MFVSMLTYRRDVSREEPLFKAHRAFIEHHINASRFLCSGPRVGTRGGLIVAYGSDEPAIRAVLDEDPFVTEGVATYELCQFNIGLADPASGLSLTA